MSNILDAIAESTKIRVSKQKELVSLEQIKDEAKQLPLLDHPFYKTLEKEGISFICECKQASPSKGQIVEDFPYLEIAKEYEKAGASAISVLTEPKWFKGKLDYLKSISEVVSIPCLRKDFTVDEYMIYEARVYGASAVLLIVSILTDEQLRNYIQITESLGMDALVECHDEEEVIRAKAAGSKIIGVNNRNLKNFTVDSTNCLRLREQVGNDCLFVAESGIKHHEDIEQLKQACVDAVLIGETMMLAQDKSKMLKELKYGQS